MTATLLPIPDDPRIARCPNCDAPLEAEAWLLPPPGEFLAVWSRIFCPSCGIQWIET